MSEILSQFSHSVKLEQPAKESDYKRKAALFIIFGINEYQRGYYASFNTAQQVESSHVDQKEIDIGSCYTRNRKPNRSLDYVYLSLIIVLHRSLKAVFTIVNSN